MPLDAETITDHAPTDVVLDERQAFIDGLHEFAGFLQSHPDVPLPDFWIYASYGKPQCVSAWVDGLDELVIVPGSIAHQRKVRRTFGALEVDMLVNPEMVGETREVPTIAEEFTPFTLDEIRARA